MEIADSPPDAGRSPALRLRLLGPMSLWRHDRELALPASRKARALLAYLAMAPQVQTRSRLCELLWELPHDPRGELRWCLSKLRGLVGDDARTRLYARGDAVGFDATDCFVDAVELERAAGSGLATLGHGRKRELCALFAGDFLEGLEVGHSPVFEAWLTAGRRRFRALQVELLGQLADGADGDEHFAWLDLISEQPQQAHVMSL